MILDVFKVVCAAGLVALAASGLVYVFWRATQLRHLHPREFDRGDWAAAATLGALLLSVPLSQTLLQAAPALVNVLLLIWLPILVGFGAWWIWSMVVQREKRRRRERQHSSR